MILEKLPDPNVAEVFRATVIEDNNGHLLIEEAMLYLTDGMSLQRPIQLPADDRRQHASTVDVKAVDILDLYSVHVNLLLYPRSLYDILVHQ